MKLRLGIIGFLLWIVSSMAMAVPMDTITSELIGDSRAGTPDNLSVFVTISFNDDNTVAMWTIDLNMLGTHPDAKLDAFWFNLSGAAGDFTLFNFGPGDWGVTGTDVKANGGGFGNAATFLFEIDKDSGDSTDVTNTQLLTFEMSLVSGGAFTMEMFFDAPGTTGAVGTGQMGAHLQALNGGCSAFAIGDYGDSGQGPVGEQTECDRVDVPEPRPLALLALGLFGLALSRRFPTKRKI